MVTGTYEAKLVCSSPYTQTGFLTLRDTPINGQIPSNIGQMTKLDTLTLSNCSLTGDIPSEIGKVSTLTSFSADGNNIVGSIPSEIGLLDRLVHLNLDSTYLSGSLPNEIQQLSNLNFLDLHDNSKMTGTIPNFIGSMESLGTNSCASCLWKLDNIVGAYPYSSCLRNIYPQRL